MRRVSIERRLQRLEAVLEATTTSRGAFIEIWPDDCVERHLVMTSPLDAQQCFFQERPGPGPQLADFGEFGLVLHLTTAEMNA